MSKYLFQASYAAEGIKGLEKDKASGRKTALSKAVENLGGKLEQSPIRLYRIRRPRNSLCIRWV